MRTSWLFLPLLLAATPIHAQAIHSTSDTKWGPPPPFLPSGAQASVVQGDPGAAGEYTIRLQMPDGYIIPPHYHPTDENVTVLSGTLLLGLGDEIDQRRRVRGREGQRPPLRDRPRADGGAGARNGPVRHHLHSRGRRSPRAAAVTAAA